MKRGFQIFMATLFIATGVTVKAQSVSLESLFGSSSSSNETVVEEVRREPIIPKKLVGKWSYMEPVVVLKSSNSFKDAAAGFLSEGFKSQIVSFIESEGIDTQTLTYHHTGSGKLSFASKDKSFGGRYILNASKSSMVMDFSETTGIADAKIETLIEYDSEAETMTILFEAKRLIEYLKGVDSTINDSMVTIVLSIIDQYDQVLLGVKLAHK